MTEKAAIRSETHAAIRRMSPEERAREEQRITEVLTNLAAWREARSVLIYHALPDEVSLAGLAQRAVEARKRLFLPRVVETSLAFAAYEPESTELHRHVFGMEEPAVSGPDGLFDPTSGPWMVICPGRAFSPRADRLGRGGGYYDHFLASPAVRKNPPVAVVGVCYEVQLRYSLPVEAHDVAMDLVVAGSGRAFDRRSRPDNHSD